MKYTDLLCCISLDFFFFFLNLPDFCVIKLKVLREKPFKNIFLYYQGSRKSKIGWELTKNGSHVWSWWLSKQPYICSFQTNIPITMVFMLFFWLSDQFGWHFPFPVAHFGCGHLFRKLFQLASQKWLPKSQIGWEHVPTVLTFLEPCLLQIDTLWYLL